MQFQNEMSKMVGAKGFEPSTPWSQTKCANQTALRPDTLTLKSSDYNET